MSNGSWVQSVGYLVIGTVAGMAISFIYPNLAGTGSGGSFKDGRIVAKLASHGPGGKYSRNELQPGDKIVKINGIPVDSSSQAYRVLQALCMSPSDSLSVDVVRRDDDGKLVKLDGPVRLDRDDIHSVLLAGAPGKKKVDCNTFTLGPDSLFDAAADGNAGAVREMLESGSKKYIDDLTDDQTPLVAAVAGGHVSVVQELIDHGADVNKPASDGTSPMMKAAAMGNQELVAMLLANGADPTARNSALQTASDIADKQGFLEISSFIDNPSPTKLLNADQRRKTIDVLSQMGNLKGPRYNISDAELGAAIKQYQRDQKLPESGLLVPTTYADLLKNSRKILNTKNGIATDETTQKTLSRVFSRSLLEHWTPVNSLTGYPDCNKETVLFQISPDQKVITWASFRPGVSEKDLAKNPKPTQTQDFKVVRADQIDGYDTILVRPDPASQDGPKYQTWEIREGSMKITLKQRDDSLDNRSLTDGKDTKDSSDDNGLGSSDRSRDLSDYSAMPGSYLAQCR